MRTDTEGYTYPYWRTLETAKWGQARIQQRKKAFPPRKPEWEEFRADLDKNLEGLEQGQAAAVHGAKDRINGSQG